MKSSSILGIISDSIDGMKQAPSVPHDSNEVKGSSTRPDIDHSSIEAYLATAPESGRLDWPGMGRGTPAHPPGASGQWKDETTTLNSTGSVTKQGSKGEDRAHWTANEELAFDDIGDTLTCNSSTAMICQRLHDSGSHSTGDAARFSRIVMPILKAVHKNCTTRTTTNKTAIEGYARIAAGKKPNKNQVLKMAIAEKHAKATKLPLLRETWEGTWNRAGHAVPWS